MKATSLLALEKGASSPSFETVLKIIEVTQCDPGWLLTGQGQAPDATTPTPAGKTAAPGRMRELTAEELEEYGIGKTEGRVEAIQQMVRAAQGFMATLLGEHKEVTPMRVGPLEAYPPEVEDGDIAALKLGDVPKPDWSMYCAWISGAIRYRRIKWIKQGSLLVSGATPADPPEELGAALVQIRGRVLGVYRPILQKFTPK